MFENGKRPHISVVGDLILDRYLIGDATKLNPEQPGVVIRVDKEEDRLGGAAAVAMIAAGFGARVTLAGVVGRDEPGRRLQRLIDSHGIEAHLWIDDRPTTWKQRIVTRGQVRPDRCDREVTTAVSDRAEQFLAGVSLGDMLLISDYGKGVCTRGLLKSIGCHARQCNVPILVDPARSRSWSDYGQVAVIKANWAEASAAWGRHKLHPEILAQYLSTRFACDVIITVGSRGLYCAELGKDTMHMPAKRTEVRDVCGAGDTVLAAAGVELARGNSLSAACRFATAAACQQVANLGVSAVHGESFCN